MSEISNSSAAPSAPSAVEEKSAAVMPLARPMERMDIRDIKAWMFDNEVRRSEIGVSPKWLAHFASEYLAGPNQLAELMDVRTAFKGSFSSMRHLMDQGFDPSEVHTLYSVRQELEANYDSQHGEWLPSLTAIGHFAQLFGLEVNDDLASEIDQVHDAVKGFNPALSLRALCKFAKKESITVLYDAIELFTAQFTVEES